MIQKAFSVRTLARPVVLHDYVRVSVFICRCMPRAYLLFESEVV